jgi:hypothetical protein
VFGIGVDGCLELLLVVVCQTPTLTPNHQRPFQTTTNDNSKEPPTSIPNNHQRQFQTTINDNSKQPSMTIQNDKCPIRNHQLSFQTN